MPRLKKVRPIGLVSIFILEEFLDLCKDTSTESYLESICVILVTSNTVSFEFVLK